MTRAGLDFEHQIPCPARIGPKDFGPLAPLPALAAPIFSPAWSVEGFWSNVDIYVEVRATWADCRFRLYSITGALRSLIVETTPAAAGLQLVGNPDSYRGIILSGRGHPGSGWLVEVANTAALQLPAGTITGEVWGHESTPEGVGNRPGLTIPDMRMGSRAAHLMAWPNGTPPTDTKPWLPVACDPTTGALIVSMGPPTPPAPARLVTDFGVSSSGVVGPLASLYSCSVRSSAAVARFLQFFASVAAPVLGAVPVLAFKIPPGTTVVLGEDFFTSGGLPLAPGAAWGWSTTETTYTPAPPVDQVIQIVTRP